MIISAGGFFIFSKFFIFQAVNVLKGQKMAQNDKKLCLLQSISPYISTAVLE